MNDELESEVVMRYVLEGWEVMKRGVEEKGKMCGEEVKEV